MDYWVHCMMSCELIGSVCDCRAVQEVAITSYRKWKRKSRRYTGKYGRWRSFSRRFHFLFHHPHSLLCYFYDNLLCFQESVVYTWVFEDVVLTHLIVFAVLSSWLNRSISVCFSHFTFILLVTIQIQQTAHHINKIDRM